MNSLKLEKLLFSFVLFLLFTTTKAQDLNITSAQTDGFKQQRTKITLYNIAINGLVGGFGNMINNKDNKTNFKAFTNGFYKGAIGGTLISTGLSMSHLIYKKRSISYAWPARIVNALGSSIVLNAAQNRRTFERFHFNLYFARLEYDAYQKKFSARLFTSSLYGLAIVGKGARFDLKKSLQAGVFYFESDGRFSSSIGSGRATGQVSSVGMRSDLTGETFYDTFAEEIAHIIQYDRLVVGNAFTMKWDKKRKEVSEFYNNLSKYIYFDLNGPLFWLAYKIENGTKCNYFEQEAVNYASRRVDFCE